MAKMYPRYLKTDAELEEAGLTPISPAERRLFDLFKRNLTDDDFSVFHGVLLQVPRKAGGISDREIDFLISHPEHGLLTIEVKGGLIRIGGATGEWASKDRFCEVHEIKDLWGLKNQSGADSAVKQPCDSHDVSLPAPDS
jgi:hypothetical protein